MNHDDDMTSADMLSPDEIHENDQAVEALLDARADEQAAEYAAEYANTTSWPDDVPEKEDGHMTAPDQIPAFGGIVHFVLREANAPDANPCRPALITAVHPTEPDGNLATPRGPEPVDLAVPEFRRYLDRVHHSEGARGTGTWHWPDEACR